MYSNSEYDALHVKPQYVTDSGTLYSDFSRVQVCAPADPDAQMGPEGWGKDERPTYLDERRLAQVAELVALCNRYGPMARNTVSNRSGISGKTISEIVAASEGALIWVGPANSRWLAVPGQEYIPPPRQRWGDIRDFLLEHGPTHSSEIARRIDAPLSTALAALHAHRETFYEHARGTHTITWGVRGVHDAETDNGDLAEVGA